MASERSDFITSSSYDKKIETITKGVKIVLKTRK